MILYLKYYLRTSAWAVTGQAVVCSPSRSAVCLTALTLILQTFISGGGRTWPLAAPAWLVWHLLMLFPSSGLCSKASRCAFPRVCVSSGRYPLLLPISADLRRRWVKSSAVVSLPRLSWHSSALLEQKLRLRWLWQRSKHSRASAWVSRCCTVLFRPPGLTGFSALGNS